MPYEPLTHAQAVANFLEKYGIPADREIEARMDLGTLAVLFSMESQVTSPC